MPLAFDGTSELLTSPVFFACQGLLALPLTLRLCCALSRSFHTYYQFGISVSTLSRHQHAQKPPARSTFSLMDVRQLSFVFFTVYFGCCLLCVLQQAPLLLARSCLTSAMRLVRESTQMTLFDRRIFFAVRCRLCVCDRSHKRGVSQVESTGSDEAVRGNGDPKDQGRRRVSTCRGKKCVQATLVNAGDVMRAPSGCVSLRE